MRNKEIATLLKTIADSFLALSEIYSSAENDFPPKKESPSVAVESSSEEEPTPCVIIFVVSTGVVFSVSKLEIKTFAESLAVV